MERILVRLGFRNCLVVDKFGKGGALALFYAEDVSLFILLILQIMLMFW